MNFSSFQALFARRSFMFFTASVVALVVLFSLVFYAKGAGLGSTNVQPASMDTGASSTVTVTFTSTTTIPANGKIKVTFGNGFKVDGASGGTCSTMDGTFVTSVNGQVVTLTRQANGTDQPGAAETCTINSISNPSVAGQSGMYTIETTDGADVQLDIDSAVASDNILAAVLTSVNVEPASLVASSTNVVTVTFTTKNTLEADGKVKVMFPAGFNVSGASGGACSSMDGSFVTSVNGQEVTLTRSGGSPEAVGPQTCTINNIVNPAATGVTGTYSIQTTANNNQLHDIANGISGDNITGGPATLTSTNVQPASLEAGSLGTATISFTTTTEIPANGKIRVFFPAGFNVSGATGGTCSTMNGTFVTSIIGLVVTLTRQNDGTSEATGAETCTINNIMNPNVAGSAGSYTIQTLDNANSVINTDTAVAADNILGGTLTNTNVQPASLVASSTNVVTVTFTTKNTLESNGRVKVTFPNGFNVSGVNGVACSSMDGGFTFNVNGQEVTINRNNAGTPEAPGPQTCTINNITNPGATGSTGTYAIQTTTNSNQMHDVDNAVAADTITSAGVGALLSTNVQPASLIAGANGNVVVSFTTATALPANGKIRVTFPGTFVISNVNGVSCSSMDGTFVFMVSGQQVVITRQNNGTIQNPGAETCTINNVFNSSIAGSTGTYAIDTMDNANTILDIDNAVAADTIVAATLTNTNVQPASLLTGVSNVVTVSFGLTIVLENNGKVKILFPNGFDVSGASGGACSSMDGAFTTSVNGQEVILSRSGGSLENAGPQTCTINNIINPPMVGSTGVYAISTTTSTDGVHEQDTAVAADTITASALTSTNVQPASLVAGVSGQATITFTTVNAIKQGGLVVVTFPSGFNVSGASAGTCSTMDGSFTTTVDGLHVTLTRSGGTTEPAGAQTCTINNIVNPTVAGSTGTYTITTATAGGLTQDTDAAVSADTLTSGVLSTTNIEPVSLLSASTTLVAINFTSSNGIENDGKIKVTFPERFIVTNATSGTCSTMDGAFATSVNGQTVTLTRAGGTTAPAGVHACTVSGIMTPSTAGLAGNYSLVTTNAWDAIHDYDAAIEGDFFTRGSGSDGVVDTKVFVINVTEPAGGTYEIGDFVPVVWSTVGSTVEPGFVTLSFSVDGGVFWETIVTNTANDGGYGWIVPEVNASSVLIKAEATDLASILASGTSAEFTLGSGDVVIEEDETEEVVVDEQEDVVNEESTEEAFENPANIAVGSLFRDVSSSTTYYLDENGFKRPFLDQQTFFTYADSFDEVLMFNDAIVAQYPEGDPMMPKAGSVLVKVPTTNNVYALEQTAGVLTLRWITTEAIAGVLYGNSWKNYVVDILASAWEHVTFGDAIVVPEHFEVDPTLFRTRDELNQR